MRLELFLSMEKCTSLNVLEKGGREVELQVSYAFPSCFKKLVIRLLTCFFVFLKGEKQGPPNLKTNHYILKLSSWAVSAD